MVARRVLMVTALLGAGVARAEPTEVARLAALEDPGAAVVLVRQGSSTCAGAFVDGHGRVVTAYHCVADGGPVVVQTRDGRRASADVASRVPGWDLAVLEVDGFAGEPWLTLREEPLRVGEAAYAWGHPLGAVQPGGYLSGTLRWSMTEGIVSAVGTRAVQITAAVNKGNSGGPVLDAEGRLIGVVSRRLQGEGLGFATRAEAVQRLLDAPHPGGLIGGSVRGEVTLSLLDATGGDVAIGGRIEAAVRDRVVFGAGGALSPGAQTRSLRFGQVRWLMGEGRVGLRQRVGSGYWTTRVELYGGAGLVQEVTALDPSESFRVDVQQRLVPMAGLRLAVATVAVDVALVPEPDGSWVGRTLLALQWPGRLGVF